MADARVRRPMVLLALVAGGLVVAGAAAWAYWSAPATVGSAGRSTAATINAGVAPAALKNSASVVTVSWSAVTLSNGTPVDGYRIKRYDSGTLAAQTLTTGCTGTQTTLTCTELSVPQGSWRYSVIPVLGTNWVGAESGLSNTVNLSGPAITLAQSYYRGPFPATATGTLSGFGANEAISYKLDGTTTLTGTPTVVGATGTAPVNGLTLPAMTQGTHTITVTGVNGSVASTTIIVDSVAPTVSATLSQNPNGAGYITTSPVQVTLSATDAVSGVAAIRYTTDGTDPSVSGTASTCTGPFSVASTVTVRYFATDAAGNASAVASRSVPIDATPPGSTVTLSSAVNAVQSGTNVYYRGSTAGSFTLTTTVSDSNSGPASGRTSALAGTTAGWAHTPSTVSTPAGGPYVSSAFSWTAGTTSTPTETVAAADVAGNTTATTLTYTSDSTPPAGGSISYTSGYLTSPSVPVTWVAGSDSGSGVAASSGLLQRAAAPMTAGVCGAYGVFSTIATPSTSPYADTTVASNTCYQYRYRISDALGNQATYSSAQVAKSPRYYTCAAAALDDTAIEYYKLNDPAGATSAADSSGFNRTGTFVGALTADPAGACSAGVTLDGATGYVTTPLQQNNPMPYAEEAWFRTTSTRGGLITGYAQNQTGSSTLYDRTVFLTNDGRISFQTATNVLIGIGYDTYLTTTARYNDGSWHHVIATQSSAGMALYLDGTLFQSNTEGGSYVTNGYWRMGYMGDLSAKTNGPASSFFAGQLSNVAFYNKLLTATQVMDHYIAGVVSSAGAVTAPAGSPAAAIQSLNRFINKPPPPPPGHGPPPPRRGAPAGAEPPPAGSPAAAIQSLNRTRPTTTPSLTPSPAPFATTTSQKAANTAPRQSLNSAPQPSTTQPDPAPATTQRQETTTPAAPQKPPVTAIPATATPSAPQQAQAPPAPTPAPPSAPVHDDNRQDDQPSRPALTIL